MGAKGCIGILTGGGDVPGLNPAIRAVTVRALRAGYWGHGIRGESGGLEGEGPDTDGGNDEHVRGLTEEEVHRPRRPPGTFLHSSRTRPSHRPRAVLPDHRRGGYTAD